ncbi:MAG: phosphoribosylaminoimidazolesuccinocarboxamide synthase [Bacteroidota bacterium]|nr:phosphoribosylaminoimidazolesuccinocarboxamide synthase [Bacteroidota bacterium]
MPISETHFTLRGQTGFYRGKVRDVYYVDDLMVAIATDRISAFDHILPKPIPYKGQVLNQIAGYFLDATNDILPNWKQSIPHPNATIGVLCEPIRIEMVIRGYLAGHALREYTAGKRELCGEIMPDGMKPNQAFKNPIITPASKATTGHDVDISLAEIVEQNILSQAVVDDLVNATRALFQRGTEMAASQGLILVDTKYEFGWYRDQLYIIDEIHTPDSSRYWYQSSYAENLENDLPQEHLSKEFVREWLMSKGFQGLEGQQMPEMNEEIVTVISERYIHLYEIMTGKPFTKAPDDPEIIQKKIEEALR